MSDWKKGPCPHEKFCADVYHVKACDGSGWYECPVFDKIEDHLMEARDNARDHPLKDDIPFCFDDDEDCGPEVEE